MYLVRILRSGGNSPKGTPSGNQANFRKKTQCNSFQFGKSQAGLGYNLGKNGRHLDPREQMNSWGRDCRGCELQGMRQADRPQSEGCSIRRIRRKKAGVAENPARNGVMPTAS